MRKAIKDDFVPFLEQHVKEGGTLTVNDLYLACMSLSVQCARFILSVMMPASTQLTETFAVLYACTAYYEDDSKLSQQLSLVRMVLERGIVDPDFSATVSPIQLLCSGMGAPSCAAQVTYVLIDYGARVRTLARPTQYPERWWSRMVAYEEERDAALVRRRSALTAFAHCCMRVHGVPRALVRFVVATMLRGRPCEWKVWRPKKRGKRK